MFENASQGYVLFCPQLHDVLFTVKKPKQIHFNKLESEYFYMLSLNASQSDD